MISKCKWPLVAVFLFALGYFCGAFFTNSSRNNDLLATNQQTIEKLKSTVLDINDIDANFETVFHSLADRVMVYPTENYYYFSMKDQGSEIWGNFRLDSIDREEGIISFAYYQVVPNSEYYYNHNNLWHKEYSAKDGVEVKKLDKLTYSVSYRGKTKIFELNNLEQKMPPDKLTPDEEFVSRMQDESGFQFYMVFNRKINWFYYILDEREPLPDILHPYGKDIYLGRLSEFAFYSDKEFDRKILFAIAERNVIRNNYYDGPFDQLADNFIDVDKFEKLVVQAYPFFKGKVKGRGDFVDENGRRKNSRISISPYHPYAAIRDIWIIFSNCEESFGRNQSEFLGCLTENPRLVAAGKRLSRK